ncbi:MAG: alpha/beta hydrolase [Pseudomonadota bacterium]
MTTTDLLEGFASTSLDTGNAKIFVRHAGNGPPLLLLHGYPQTHVHWHRLAPKLTKRFTVYCADLRGYGASSIPETDAEHAPYSKRAMARDMLDVMTHFGHARFSLGGHDRGGRVAYRLALDHPDRVKQLLLFDIVPTIDVWDDMRWNTAISAYHWPFLAQAHPLPETLINANPEFYCDWTLRSWTGAQSIDVFDPIALNAYRAQMADPDRVHAMCEDYRAGATFDRKLDAADREAGRKIDMPTLMMWSETYLVARSQAGPKQTWEHWCSNLTAEPIPSGHFLAEEAPDACAAAIFRFFNDT